MNYQIIIAEQLPNYIQIPGFEKCLRKQSPDLEFNEQNETVIIEQNDTDCLPIYRPSTCPEKVWQKIMEIEQIDNLTACRDGKKFSQ